MLKILGRASSINVRKVLWVCDELNLPYEREDWGTAAHPTNVPEYLALNPNGLMPVIKDGDFVLWESNTIIRYLASRYGDGGLYPTSPIERARVDQWMDWQASDLNPAWSYAFLGLVRKSPAHGDKDAVVASIGRWTRFMHVLDKQLAASGGYVAGRTFSLADIPIGLSVNRWFNTPFDHPDLPAVSHYLERLTERPAFVAHGKNGMP